MSTPLRERPDAPLGTLIFRAGLLPAETIENALEEGVKTGKRLGEILTERGLLKEVDLARLLAGQKGLPFVTLREQIVDPAAAGLFSEDQARLFRALPYGFEDGVPVVAITDPTDEVLTRNVREALGRDDARFVVSTRGELTELIGDVYAREVPAAPSAPAPVVTPEPAPEPAPAPVAVQPPVEPQPAPAPAEPAPPIVPAAPEPALNGSGRLNGHAEHEPVPAPLPAAAPAPAPAPEPEPEPVVAQVPAPAVPEPAMPEPVAPEPVEPAPIVEPAQPAFQVPVPAEPVAAPEPAPEPVAPTLPAAAADPAPAPSGTTYRLSVRLTNGERVEVGSYDELSLAKAEAKALMAQVAAADGGDWPFVSGRFLKPDTIVSVDLA